MRLLLGCERLDLVGGSERYAADVATGLKARGHEVHVVTGRAGEALGVDVTELPGLFDHEASPSALSAFELELRNDPPDRVLFLSRAAPEVLRASSERAPTARFVQDHTLFCPGLNKLHADGSACCDPMGAACLKRFFNTVLNQWLVDDREHLFRHGFSCWKKPCAIAGDGEKAFTNI